MLECASPPIYVAVDGHAYGVFEVRSTAELERQHASAAAGGAAAAASPAANSSGSAARRSGAELE